jgi:putative MATE family efflux protein
VELKQHTTDLGTQPLGPLLIRLSVPGMVAFLTMTLYNVVNTFWVSHLGAGAIAALAVVFPFQMVNVALGAGTGIGISSLSSRLFGKSDAVSASRVAGQVYFLSIALGLITLFAGIFFTDPILKLFNALPEFQAMSHTYLYIISFGTPFLYFMMMANNLLRGSGDVKTPMYISVASALLNAILDPFLIFGLGPFPVLGVAGAALGTIISQVLGAIAYFIYLAGPHSAYRVHPRIALPSLRYIKEIYRVGAPAMIMQLTGSLVIIVFNHFLGAFGTVAIAAYGLLFRIAGVFMMPIMGMAQGLMPIVGYNFGAGNYRRMWQAVRVATIYATLLTTGAEILLLVFATPMTAIFAHDPLLLAEATFALRVAMLAQFLVGAQFMWMTALQGMRRGGEALALSLLRQLIVLIPAIIILSHFFGLKGIWVSMPVSDAIAFGITFAWILAVRRKVGVVSPQAPATPAL